jgi:AcrR family transcriptional regulator
MSAAPATRRSAEERRREIVEIAIAHFAQNGYNGTSTDHVAREAGISQPYLFRLFGSKKELYLAAAQRSIDAQYAAFAEAAKGKTGEAALRAMGEAYKGGIAHDRDHLMLMLKTWSSDDPDFRRLSRTAWRNIVDLAEQSSREPPEVVSRFFANGMLITILMSMGLSEDPEPWATRLLEACLEAIEE